MESLSKAEQTELAAASLARVNELLKAPVPAWSNVAHKKLSDLFMLAMCGDKYMTAAPACTARN